MNKKTSMNNAYQHMFFMLLAISFSIMREQWFIIVMIFPSFVIHSIITFFAITKKIDVKALSGSLFIPAFYLLFSTVEAQKIHPYLFWSFMFCGALLMFSHFQMFFKLLGKWSDLKQILNSITPNSFKNIHNIKFFISKGCHPFEINYKDSDVSIQLVNTETYFMNINNQWLMADRVKILLKEINQNSIFSLESKDLELMEMLDI